MSLSFGLTVKPKSSDPRSKQSLNQNKISLGNDDNDGNDNGLDSFGAENDNDASPVEAIEELDSFSNVSRPSRPITKLASSKQTKTHGGGPPPSLKSRPGKDKDTSNFTDLSSNRQSLAQSTKATSLDPTIYDYDAYHEAATSLTAARKAQEKASSASTSSDPASSNARKPKYMDNLLSAAAKRKTDQLIAREKVLQRERELEGDEFADKEKFVTAAYKMQQEETRRAEAAETAKREAEAKKRGAVAGAMSGFYRHVLDASEERYKDAKETARILESGSGLPSAAITATEEQNDGNDGHKKTDLEIAAEMRAKGVDVQVNDEGQVADKRQLLSAGLNITAPAPQPPNPSSAASRSSESRNGQSAAGFKAGDQRNSSARARQTKMLEEQLAQNRKRAAEEDEEERARIAEKAKSKKSVGEISDAKARYLTRKAEAAAAAAGGAEKGRS